MLCGRAQAGIEKRDQARIGAANSWMSNSWLSLSGGRFRHAPRPCRRVRRGRGDWLRTGGRGRIDVVFGAVLEQAHRPVSASWLSQKLSSSLPPDSERPVARRCSSAASRERRSREPKRVRFMGVPENTKTGFYQPVKSSAVAMHPFEGRNPHADLSLAAKSLDYKTPPHLATYTQPAFLEQSATLISSCASCHRPISPI
jgi:hypothetical protein